MNALHPEIEPRLENYVVELGHMRVTVDGRNPAEALSRARVRFALDMPRLWDVIHGTPDDRFRITPVR